MEPKYSVVDAHQDLAFSMVSYLRPFASTRANYMLTETSWRKSGLAWSWCTLFVHPQYQDPLHMELAVETEFAVYDELLAHYSGWLVPVGRKDDLRLLSRFGGQLGISLLMEGAEPVASPSELERFFVRGVRALGLVWHNKNMYAGGNLAEGGLSDPGRQLLDEAARLGIAIDLSHLNKESFWDVIEYRNSRLPHLHLFASHANSAAVCPHSRNLDDDQLAAIRECGGAVGLVLYNEYLDPAWKRTDYGDKHVLAPEEIWAEGVTPESLAQRLVHKTQEDPPLEDVAPGAEPAADVGLDIVLDHIDYLSDVLGEGGVALGSDFDGGLTRFNTPAPFRDFADIGILGAAVADRWGEDFARGFMGENWLKYWQEALPE